MRAFIAIDVSEPVREQLAALAPSIRASGLSGPLIRPESIHLTLKFLGEIQSSQIDRVQLAMAEVARRRESFLLDVRGVGVFPHLERPRVLWAGISPRGEIEGLQAELEGQLAGLGFAPEAKPFHPHLTLARLKRVPDRRSFVHFIQRNTTLHFGRIQVSEVLLFQSLLKPQGAEYNVLSRVSLYHPGAGAAEKSRER